VLVNWSMREFGKPHLSTTQVFVLTGGRDPIVASEVEHGGWERQEGLYVKNFLISLPGWVNVLLHRLLITSVVVSLDAIGEDPDLLSVGGMCAHRFTSEDKELSKALKMVGLRTGAITVSAEYGGLLENREELYGLLLDSLTHEFRHAWQYSSLEKSFQDKSFDRHATHQSYLFSIEEVDARVSGARERARRMGVRFIEALISSASMSEGRFEDDEDLKDWITTMLAYYAKTYRGITNPQIEEALSRIVYG